MATTTTVPTPDSAQPTAAQGETLADKIARYGSPEFTAAAIRHFDSARKKAYERILKQRRKSADIPQDRA